MNEITRRLFNKGSVRVKVDQRNIRLILEPARAVWALDSNKNMFVVTADTLDISADMTIPIYPSIVTSGAYQTVVASPGNGELLTFVGTEGTAYPINLAFQKLNVPEKGLAFCLFDLVHYI